MKPAILVHGGAAKVPSEILTAREEGCRRAVQAGWKILERGGSALDAVEAAVMVMEEDPVFNAGRGSALTMEGQIEMDAAIMDGSTLRAGAVGAVKNILHPIRLARLVMEKTPHILIVGDGALRLARLYGLEEYPLESLSTERQRLQWKNAGFFPYEGDTVGAVAIDRNGNVAAATSTGGLAGKLPGRLGDTPLIGCGTYADNLAGAASATGTGEAIIMVVLAKTACDLMRQGLNPREAARIAIQILEERTGGQGGIILVNGEGQLGWAFNTEHMPIAFKEGDR
ncbi:MAG: isoaspartyl peptidase/L-asparaginase [Anaerolineae bacterium]|nr:isoaspartyl peptidase/L-asparaginase [Anaerolineae bacterium]MDW8101264.1 isoaspartyl peptidase/L-asparaginase [Anaerolineae bacterium]